jgi:hypothetical protein
MAANPMTVGKNIQFKKQKDSHRVQGYGVLMVSGDEFFEV